MVESVDSNAVASSYQLASSYQPEGNGELVMCVPKGGLHEFILLHSFPVPLEYDIMTLFTDTNTLAIYKTGGDFSPVTTAHESLGYTEADIWTPQELSSHNSEILFKRGLAKMAVAAISYKITYLIGEVAKMSNSNKESRKKLRQSIVRLSTKRKSAMNFLRSRTNKFNSMSKNFIAQDLILRIVATCYDEFLSDISHPKVEYIDRGEVRNKCLSVATTFAEDSSMLKEILKPPGTKKQNALSLAFTLDEIWFSGNMPMFKEYLNSYVVFEKINPYELTWNEIFFQSDIRNEVICTVYTNIPFFALCMVDILLRGVAQVYLCNHPLSGLLISLALYITAPQLFIFALVGCFGSTLSSFIISRESWENIQSGLCGYDGTLVGCAVYTFIDLNSHKPVDVNNVGLFYAFILAGVAGLVHSAAANVSKLPALTAAFNIVMVFFMSAIGRRTSETAKLKWSTPYDSSSDTGMTNTTMTGGDEEDDYKAMTGERFWRATILGVGQFIFVNTDVGASMVIFAVLMCSRKAAGMALLGSITGTLVSLYVVDVPRSSDDALWTGLYSYNCMGTAVAIGGDIFFESNFGAVLIGVIGAAMAGFFTVVVQSYLATDGLNLPVMTIPFCITTWLLMTFKTKWLVATVGADVDLDDAMFLDRRHDGQEQAVLENLLSIVKSPGQLTNLLHRAQGDRRGENNSSNQYRVLDDGIDLDSLVNDNDTDPTLSSDEEDEGNGPTDKNLEIEIAI